jgi:hypothetical protein
MGVKSPHGHLSGQLPLRPRALPGHRCNCSVCTKKGFIHLIVPPEQFQLLSGEEDLASYRFNTQTANHRFCRICGIHPFYVPRSDPDKMDVNVRCLENVDVTTLKPVQFDGKNWEYAIVGHRDREAQRNRDA